MALRQLNPQNRMPSFPLVILHGPAGCGKDTAFKQIARRYRANRWAVADQIKSAVHRIIGLAVEPSYYESCKDQPHPDFGGKSPRQAYIDYSNEYRATHGLDVFVRQTAENILIAGTREPDVVQVVTDCRLALEWDIYQMVSSEAVLWKIQAIGVEWRPGDVGDGYIADHDALLCNDLGRGDCEAPFSWWVDEAVRKTVDVERLRRVA